MCWSRKDGLSRSAESLGFPWSPGLDAPTIFGEQLLDWTRKKENWTRQKGPFRKKGQDLGGGGSDLWVPFYPHPSVCQADPKPNLCPGKSVSVAGTRPIWQEHTAVVGTPESPSSASFSLLFARTQRAFSQHPFYFTSRTAGDF